MSDSVIHCLLPRGSGTNLPVKVVSSACMDAFAVPLAHSPQAQFTYDETAVEKLVRGNQALEMQLPQLPIFLHRGLVTDLSEVKSYNSVTQRDEYFGLAPAMVPLLPKGDLQPRFDSCAVVGPSGTLSGSHLGAVIDSANAVFRTDNSPSALKHAADVGRRTTFQVCHNFCDKLITKMYVS